MTNKELSKLRRGELLEMLLAQTKEVERLKWELDIANKALEKRELMIDKSGSIAEAALQVNGVFEAAQKAAEQYLENIENLSKRQEEICSEREEKSKQDADRMLTEIQNKCELMMQQCEKKTAETDRLCGEQTQVTELKCDEKLRRTEEECEEKLRETEEQCTNKVRETEEQCTNKVRETDERCTNRLRETEEQCANKISETEKQVEEKWSLISQRLEEAYKAKKGLRELVDFIGKNE